MWLVWNGIHALGESEGTQDTGKEKKREGEGGEGMNWLQIHNVAVKYTQGYLKKNPEMAKIVEAQRMRKVREGKLRWDFD